MKNESNKNTVIFTKEIILGLCTITATPLCGIVWALSSYLGGIYNAIIFWSLFVLCCHNFVIPFYKYKIKGENWDNVRPSMLFTVLCLITIVGVLSYRYIAPRISNAGYNKSLKDLDTSEIPTHNAAPEATQKPPADTVSSLIIYTVIKGDTLFSLAQEYNTTIDKILADNIGKYPTMTRDYIVVGWEIIITQ